MLSSGSSLIRKKVMIEAKSKGKMAFCSVLFLILAAGQFVYAGYIYEKSLGNECLYDEDCITRNSFCKGNKICACKIGYQYDPGSDVCFPKEVDLKCSEDYDCSALQNARCKYGKCQCKYDYVPSKDKSHCLPSMKLTSLCEEDSQCNSVMNRSYCDPVMKHCVCERGLQRDSYRMLCIEKTKLHQSCSSLSDCEEFEENRGKVECKYSGSGLVKTCECAEGYIEHNDTCISVANSQAEVSLLALAVFFLVKWVV